MADAPTRLSRVLVSGGSRGLGLAFCRRHLALGLSVVRSLQLTRHAVRAMMVRGGGTILNVSSICATRGFPGVTAHAASKGALEAFTRSAARELGPHGIAVNCIAPGYFESELSALLPRVRAGRA